MAKKNTLSLEQVLNLFKFSSIPVYLLIIVYSLSFFSPVKGQNEVLFLNKLDAENGLSQTTNKYIYTDSSGYTWISSLDGLNLYDGKQVKNYTVGGNTNTSIHGNIIQSNIFEIQKGIIKFSTYEALNSFSQKQGKFSSKKIQKETDTDNRYYLFHVDSLNNSWLIYNGNLYYESFAQDTFIQITNDNSFPGGRYSYSYDKKSQIYTIYIALWSYKSGGLEVVRLNQKKEIISRENFFSQNSNDSTYEQLSVFDIFPEKNETIWAITNRGLLNLNIKKNEFEIFKVAQKNGLPRSILDISSTYLLVSFESGKLFFFNKKKRIFSKNYIILADAETRKPLKDLDWLFSSDKKTLWFNIPGQGVYYGNIGKRSILPLFFSNNLEGTNVHHLFQTDEKNIACSNDYGETWLFDSGGNLIEKSTAPEYSKKIRTSDNTVYRISARGLEEKIKSNFKLILPANKLLKDLYDIVEYNSKWLIIGANTGFCFFNRQTYQISPIYGNSLVVRLFIDSKQRLWVGNANNTMDCRQLSLQTEKIPPLEKTFNNCGLINHITEDTESGLIRVATSNGLLNITNNKSLEGTLITKKEGLPDNFIHATLKDNNNHLWLSTNKGIIRFNPEAKREQRFKHYKFKDGLSSNEYSPGAALKTKDGRLWFGSTKGVDVFHPDSIRDVGDPPKLAINDLKIFNKSWKGKYTINYTDYLELNTDENSLLFDLAALEYTDPSRNTFKAYLTSNNKTDTFDLGTESTIRFPYLQPGQYKFAFTAANAEGIWQDKPKELQFYIRPPYYQTWWFRILVLLGLIGLVALFLTLYYRAQLRAQLLVSERKEREAERERTVLENKLFMETERARIAGEMHDEIGGGLSTIRNAAAMAARKKKPEEIVPVLQRVSQISINLITNMRAIIWAMDPENDSLEDLCGYLRRFVAEFLQDNSIDANIEIPLDLPDIELSGKFRHNIMLVIKETLHNIIKHAQASEVSFKLNLSENLQLEIEDDGIGFEESTLKRRGHGLRNMRNRTTGLGGNIQWSARSSGGTKVKIQVPLPRKDI